VLEIDGVGHHYVVVNLASEKSVFGVDPRELPHDLDNGLHVPTVLITMRQYLVSSEGLRSEGIFRLAPDEAEALTIKAQLNKSEFTRCADVNCIANLIKVWFRELPVQLLNSLPSSSFNHAETDEDCLALYQSLKEPNKTLFRWLIRLMAQTTQLEQVNKMGPRNLAIVIAPNLFTSMEEMSPLESLGLSQNVVNFVRILLDHSIKFGDLPA
ncbi:MAG: Rho GTPase-activating protein, partial [archaeon]|nr:Rho GTPase-activating protein [archaeon]